MSDRQLTATLYLAVGLGSMLGGLARWAVAAAFLVWLGDGFPWGTLFANVSGSCLIGCYATLAGPGGPRPAGPHAWQFMVAGICGGYTTFSIFSLESLRLLQAGQAGLAGLYVGASVVTWLLAAWAGCWLAVRLAGRDPGRLAA